MLKKKDFTDLSSWPRISEDGAIDRNMSTAYMINSLGDITMSGAEIAQRRQLSFMVVKVMQAVRTSRRKERKIKGHLTMVTLILDFLNFIIFDV